MAGAGASLNVIVGLSFPLDDAAAVWAGGTFGFSFKTTRVTDFSGPTTPSLRQMVMVTAGQRILMVALRTGSLHMLAKGLCDEEIAPTTFGDRGVSDDLAV